MNETDLTGYKRQIESALEYAGGSHTFDDVSQAVVQGRFQFWPGVRSVVITEILEYPQFRALNFFLAGGELAELQAMYPGIEEWARGRGCARAVFTGRRGWGRTFLTTSGYEPKLEVFEKVLGDG